MPSKTLALAVMFKYIRVPPTTRQLKDSTFDEIKIQNIEIEKYLIWLLKYYFG